MSDYGKGLCCWFILIYSTETKLKSQSEEQPETQVELLFDRLSEQIDNSCVSTQDLPEGGVELMFYFDKSHVLAECKILNDPSDIDAYDVLCLALAVLQGLPVFTVFFSTTSYLGILAPRGKLAIAARVRDSSSSLSASVTEIPFDCSPSLKAEDLCDIQPTT